MALQLRRGSNSEIMGFTPAQGEPLYDTTNGSLVVGDGITVGGLPVGSTIESKDIADFNVPLYPNQSVSEAGGDGTDVTITVPSLHGYSAGDTVYIELNAIDLPKGNYTVSTVLDTQRFTVAYPLSVGLTVESGFTRTAGYNITDGSLFQWSEASSNWTPVTFDTLSQKPYTFTANGVGAYNIAGKGLQGTEDNPTLYVSRGETYLIISDNIGHPLQIQSTTGIGGTLYSDGVTGVQPVSQGQLVWEVRMDAPSTLYYQCQNHAAMNGTINVR